MFGGIEDQMTDLRKAGLVIGIGQRFGEALADPRTETEPVGGWIRQRQLAGGEEHCLRWGT